ncbi:MAG: ribonuclease P protein component [Candidatus Melainabacteria bacterium]|jgi:ribonuclease P protein component
MALPKSEKLKRRSAFRSTHNLKLITRNPFFKLLGKLSYQPQQERYPQVGLVVGKKKMKRAVDRNRAKRKLEEAYRMGKDFFSPELFRYEYLVFFLEDTILEASWIDLCDALKPIKTRKF